MTRPGAFSRVATRVRFTGGDGFDSVLWREHNVPTAIQPAVGKFAPGQDDFR